MKKINLFASLLFLFLALNISAGEYFTFLYTTELGEDLAEVLQKFVKDDAVIDADTPLVQKIMKKNPNVKDWRHLASGLTIELYLPEEFIDQDKYKKYSEKTKISIEKKIVEKKEISTKTDYFLGLKSSFFYMTSQGLFTQKSNDGISLNFTQNTPVTAGVSLNYFPKNTLFSTSASAYFAYLVPAVSNISSENTKTPPEIGFNIFGEYRLLNQNLTLYGGPDIERFSTFNTEGIANENKIYVDQNKVIYATLGMQRSIDIFNKHIFIKTSLSKSILSKYENAFPNHQLNPDPYQGIKYLLYINYKFSPKFYFHSLIKYHVMSGPSNLTVLRVGIGFGYILF